MSSCASRGRTLLALLFGLLVLTGCERVVVMSTGGEVVAPARLRGDLSDALLVDVRWPDEFEAGHIPGSVRVDPGDVNGFFHHARAEGDRVTVVICRSGYRAALAAPSARREGFTRAYILEGGLERWQSEGLPIERGKQGITSPLSKPMHVTLTRRQQFVAFMSGGVIKPTYMLLTLIVAFVLRRAKSPDLRLLFHGSLWFFIGEAFCALNYYLHTPGFSYPIDILHGAGMVVMSALIPWGLFRLIDDRVLHFSAPDKGCMVQRLCGRCWKRDPVRCGPHDIMLLLVIASALVSLMPLSAALRPANWETEVFGSTVEYGAPILNHIVELRLYPLLGTLVLLVAFALLWGNAKAIRRAEPVFFAGLGFVAYSSLRHLLINTYRDELYWSDFWEETTELMLIAFLGTLLIVFRRQLGLVTDDKERKQEPAAELPAA